MTDKRKITFVHPQGHNWVSGETDVTRIANIMPPHGIMMLAAVLERAGHQASIVDLFARPLPADEAVSAILSTEPDAVGFSTTTAGFLDGYRVAERLKSLRPGLKIIFGGPHPTSLWKSLLPTFPALDMLVVGEGEETILELLEAGLEPSTDIKGVAFRGPGGEPLFGGARERMHDLDSLPYLAYEKLIGFPKSYPMPIFNYPRSPATTFITSRGCPYTCSYCDRSVFGSSFRYHSAEYLVDHLAFLQARHGIRHVGIYDDNFTLNKNRAAAFAELLLQRGLGISFNCIGRSNHLDQELLRLLKRAGCWMINLGVESGDQELISQHRQRAELDRVVEAVRMVRAAGIRAKGLFMMGIPGETEQSIERTIDFAVRQHFDDVNLTKFTPFPGSPIYERIREFGQFDEDWEKMNCTNFVFIPHGFTLERLESLYVKFYRSYYTRPAGLWNFVSMLWKSPESCYRFGSNLGQFLQVGRAMGAHHAKAASGPS